MITVEFSCDICGRKCEWRELSVIGMFKKAQEIKSWWFHGMDLCGDCTKHAVNALRSKKNNSDSVQAATVDTAVP